MSFTGDVVVYIVNIVVLKYGLILLFKSVIKFGYVYFWMNVEVIYSGMCVVYVIVYVSFSFFGASAYLIIVLNVIDSNFVSKKLIVIVFCILYLCLRYFVVNNLYV